MNSRVKQLREDINILTGKNFCHSHLQEIHNQLLPLASKYKLGWELEFTSDMSPEMIKDVVCQITGYRFKNDFSQRLSNVFQLTTDLSLENENPSYDKYELISPPVGILTSFTMLVNVATTLHTLRTEFPSSASIHLNVSIPRGDMHSVCPWTVAYEMGRIEQHHLLKFGRWGNKYAMPVVHTLRDALHPAGSFAGVTSDERRALAWDALTANPDDKRLTVNIKGWWDRKASHARQNWLECRIPCACAHSMPGALVTTLIAFCAVVEGGMTTPMPPSEIDAWLTRISR